MKQIENKLLKLTKKGVFNTSSLHLSAWMPRKQHAHIMRDIKILIENKHPLFVDNFSESKFGLANYKDKQGKPRPYYLLTYEQAFLMIMRYDTKEARAMQMVAFENLNQSKLQSEARYNLLNETSAGTDLIRDAWIQIYQEPANASVYATFFNYQMQDVTGYTATYFKKQIKKYLGISKDINVRDFLDVYTLKDLKKAQAFIIGFLERGKKLQDIPLLLNFKEPIHPFEYFLKEEYRKIVELLDAQK